jgi:predicted HAD superfamily Cof-like phosphohydrolase
MTNADLVAEFHRAVGDDTPQGPEVPGLATLDLRESLINEECREVGQEFGRLRERLAGAPPVSIDALAPLAHELADLLYVTYGTFVALGLPADAIFEQVHRANLAKSAGPRRSDGKQLRPAGWSPADVLGVVRSADRRAR